MIPKTNPMRHLDKLGIPYEVHTYEADQKLTGTDIADMLGEEHARVFKTLVTIAKSKRHYVFVIPVDLELDLKKAAASVGEKSLEMLPSKDLLALTGYVHGGCSPVGMKKEFPSFIDESADGFETVFVSAGKVGFQIEVSPRDLQSLIRFRTADLTAEDRSAEEEEA